MRLKTGPKVILIVGGVLGVGLAINYGLQFLPSPPKKEVVQQAPEVAPPPQQVTPPVQQAAPAPAPAPVAEQPINAGLSNLLKQGEKK